jgi:hypothetical protein
VYNNIRKEKNMFKIIIFVLITIFTLTGCGGESYQRHRSCVTAVRACEEWRDITDNTRMKCLESAFADVCHVIPDEPLVNIIRKVKDVN